MAEISYDYLVIDGDSIGDKLAMIYLSNAEHQLVEFDMALRNRMEQAETMLRELGFEMLASGADGITCKGTPFDIGSCFSQLNEITDPFTFSVGIGQDLRDAFVALRFAKASGRNKWARLRDDGAFDLGPT